jgi:hypothetical protein
MPISDSLYANSRTPDIGKSAGLGWLLAIKSGDVEISGGGIGSSFMNYEFVMLVFE